MSTGFAVAPLADGPSVEGPGTSHRTLTDSLGCTDTFVDVYRISDSSVALARGREQVVVPLTGPITLRGTDPVRAGRHAVGRVPAGDRCEIGARTDVTVLVVGATVTGKTGTGSVVVERSALSFSESTGTGYTERLTDRLGCRGTKVNLRLLDPGEAIPYHTEGDQEELYVPLDGRGTLRVDGATRSVHQHHLARVAPTVPRAAVNAGDESRLWLMIGAPPTGDPDDWAPGVRLQEWNG